MAVVGVLLIGAGVFLMYEAYKNPNPAPVAKATSSIKSAGASGG